MRQSVRRVPVSAPYKGRTGHGDARCSPRGWALVTPLPLPDVIMTRAEVAAWLKVKPRQVERLGVPVLDLGRKTKRYLAQDVQAWLEKRRAA